MGRGGSITTRRGVIILGVTVRVPSASGFGGGIRVQGRGTDGVFLLDIFDGGEVGGEELVVGGPEGGEKEGEEGRYEEDYDGVVFPDGKGFLEGSGGGGRKGKE